MLAQALKVVEAARALAIQPGKAGLYHATLDPLHVSRALREIARSIQEFDRSTGHGDDAKALLGRALRFAAGRGIDPRDMMAAIGPGREQAPEEEAASDLVPRPGEVGVPDRVRDVSTTRQAHLHGDPVTGLGSDLPPAYATDPSFPGTVEPDGVAAKDVSTNGEREDPARLVPRAPKPGDDILDRKRREAAEAAAQIREIGKAEARLDAVAQRVGWTPALKAVDAQLRRAYGALESVVAGVAAAEAVGPATERILARAEEALRKLESGDFDDLDMEPESTAFAPR